MITSLPSIATADARRLFLHGQRLLDDPTRRSGPQAVAKLVHKLGFVQVDSIQRIARAHHLILGARLDSYRTTHLDHATFKHRVLFEHWTHDAALIPLAWFKYWQPRFTHTEQRLRKSRWFTHRLGADPETTLAHVRNRIEREGALRSSDFERSATQPATGWWDWTPEKAALEFLWHTGHLSIAGRDRFQKIYDLTTRVFPDIHRHEPPLETERIHWACSEALNRLGAAPPGELAAYFAAITPSQAATWCREQLSAGHIVSVMIEPAGGEKPRAVFAVIDWQKRLRRLDVAPDRIRLLAPFDPIVRDRKRVQRLFGFDYRFEAFVPQKKRRYGYYVMPVLEGERFIGRIDPRYDRDAQTLVIEKVWWEANIKVTKERRRKLEAALAILAQQIGASDIKLKLRN